MDDLNLLPQQEEQAPTETEPLFTEEDYQNNDRKVGNYPTLQAGIAHATDVPATDTPVNAKEVADLAFKSVNAERNIAAEGVAKSFSVTGNEGGYEWISKDIKRRMDLEGAKSQQDFEVYKQKLDEIFKHATENIVAENPRVLANNTPVIVPTVEKVGAQTAADARMEKDLQDVMGDWKTWAKGVAVALGPFAISEGITLTRIAEQHGVDPQDIGYFQGRTNTREKLQFHYNNLPAAEKRAWLEGLWNDMRDSWGISNLQAASLIMELWEGSPSGEFDGTLDLISNVGDVIAPLVTVGIATRSAKMISVASRLRTVTKARAVAGGKAGLTAEEAAKIQASLKTANNMTLKAVGAVAGDLTGVSTVVDAGKLISTGVRKLFTDEITLHAQDLLKPIYQDVEETTKKLRQVLQAQGVSAPEIERSIADFQRKFSAADNPHIHQVDFFTPDDLSETTARVVYKAQHGSFSTAKAAEEWAKANGITSFKIIPDTTNTGHLVSAERKMALQTRKAELEARIAEMRAREGKAKGEPAAEGNVPPKLPRSITSSKALDIPVQGKLKFTAKFSDAYDKILYQVAELSNKASPLTKAEKQKLLMLSSYLKAAGLEGIELEIAMDRVMDVVQKLKNSEQAVTDESFIVPKITFPDDPRMKAFKSPKGETAGVRYEVYDTQTGQVLGNYKNRHRARSHADKKDSEYGAVRYGVRPIYAADQFGAAQKSYSGPVATLADGVEFPEKFSHAVIDRITNQIVSFHDTPRAALDKAVDMMNTHGGEDWEILDAYEVYQRTGREIPKDAMGAYTIGPRYDEGNYDDLFAYADSLFESIGEGDHLKMFYTTTSDHRVVTNEFASDPLMMELLNKLDKDMGLGEQRLIIHSEPTVLQILDESTDPDDRQAAQVLKDLFAYWDKSGSSNGLYMKDLDGVHHIFMRTPIGEDKVTKMAYAEVFAHEYGHFFEAVWINKYGQQLQNEFAAYLLKKGVKGSKLGPADWKAYAEMRNPFAAAQEAEHMRMRGMTEDEYMAFLGNEMHVWASRWQEWFAERFATYALGDEKFVGTLGEAWKAIVDGFRNIAKAIREKFGLASDENTFVSKMLNNHVERLKSGVVLPPPVDHPFGAAMDRFYFEGQHLGMEPHKIPARRKDFEDELAGVIEELRAADDAEKGLVHGFLVEGKYNKKLGYNAIAGFDPEDITSMARFAFGDWAIGSSSELYRQRVTGVHAESRYGRILVEFIRPSLERLSKPERMLLDNILVMGDKEGRVFEPNELYGFPGTNRKVADAYYRTRALRDMMYDIRNDTAVQVMTKQGHRVIKTKGIVLDDDSAQLIGRVTTDPARLAGRRVWNAIEKKWVDAEDLTKYDVIELADNVSIDGNKYSILAMPKGSWKEGKIEKVIPYRAGEYKRIYSDEYWIKVKSLETVDGTPKEVLKVWRTAKSAAEANRFIKEVNEAVDAIKAGRRAEDIAHLVEKYAIHPETLVQEVRAGKWDGVQLEQNYNRTEDDYVNEYVRNFNGWSAPRGERVTSIHGEDTVNTVNPIDAIGAEISSSARVASISDWREAAINRWFLEFKDDLPMEYQRMGAEDAFWKFYNDKGSYIGGSQRRLFMERTSKYIVHELQIPTQEERYIQGFFRQLSEAVEGRMPEGHAATYVVGSALRNTRNFPKWVRSISFHSFFGFNPIQFLVQGQNAINAFAISPTHGIKAAYNAVALRLALMSDQEHIWRNMGRMQNLAELGLKDVDEFVETVRALKRSGLLDGIASTSMYSAEVGKFGLFNGISRKAGGTSAFFFNRGEEMSRIVSFDIARREFMVDNPGVAWWTDQNLQKIIGRQDDLTQNMTRANQAGWQKGVLSIPTQFMQYQVKFMLNFFRAMSGNSRAFSRADAAKLFMIHAAMYGTAGLFLFDPIRNLLGAWTDDLSDDQRLAVQQGLIAGSINLTSKMMTGEDMKVAYGTRLNTFNFYEDFVDGLLASMDKNNPDAPTFLEVMMGASGFSGARIATGLARAAKMWYAAPMNEETLKEGLAIIGASSFSVFNNAQKWFILKGNYNFVQDSKRNNLYKVTDMEAYALMFGMIPAAAEDVTTLFKDAKRWKDDVKTYSEQVTLWQRLATEAIRNKNDTLANSYISAIQVTLNGLPIKMRGEVMQAVRLKAPESIQRKLLVDEYVNGTQPSDVLVNKDFGRMN